MADRPIPETPFTASELDASLERLGIRELEQRLEFSPLLVDQGLDPTGEQMGVPCCVCKITDPSVLDGNGMLPYPHMDPGFD